jgi:hypothetical protein
MAENLAFFDFTVRLDNGIPPPTVPEPSSLLLLSFGMAGVVGLARRKGRAGKGDGVDST